MLFHSFDYLIFLSIVFVLYLSFRRSRFHNVIMLIASYVFYCYGSINLIYYILFSSILDYYLGPKIEQCQNKKTRRNLLILSLTGNLGLLFTLKYAFWLAKAASQLLNGPTVLDDIPEFTLPPGISFYTFQTLTYTIDIYRGELKSTKNVLAFFTYVAFFPQLIAGPIERCRNLLPQLSQNRPLASATQIEFSIFLIFWGLFKKVVLADNLGNIADILYSDPTKIAGGIIILPLAFCFQIYCDFSAYTDIARGSAGLFNIQLSRNFLTPYFASSPSDFWRRWHITLSTWLRDYLYIPLGGNRKGKVNTLFALMVTMFLGGLWHGAGLFFILWGIYHGFLLVLYRLFPIDKYLINLWGKNGKIIAMLIMFFLICFGWLLFRTDTEVIKPLFSTLSTLFFNPLDIEFWHFLYVTILFSTPVIITDYFGFRQGTEFVDIYKKLSPKIKAALFICMYFAITLLAKREGYGFIYFQF